MGKILGYLALAGLAWLTYKEIQKAKTDDKPKLRK